MRNVVLIGMPASGKSTAGVVLAKVLGMDFTDTDLLVQKAGKGRLSDIIGRIGNEEFLRLEERVCRALEGGNMVIATGGSVVYSPGAMEHLKEIGTVVYLQVEFGRLSDRLRDVKARGVVLPEGTSLAELYRERCVLYERYADIVVEEKDLGLEETVAVIRERLERMCVRI